MESMQNKIENIYKKMEGTQNQILYIVAFIALGVAGNYFSVPLLQKYNYILGGISTFTIVYIGGATWGIFALKTSKAYRVNNDAEQLNIHNHYIEQFTQYNSLTNLPNRTSLEKIFDLNLAKEANNGMKVLFVDVDGFKLVNDTLGHSAGDEILIVIGKRIKHILDGKGELFHIRGDEFVILLSNNETVEETAKLASNVIKSMVEPFNYERTDFHLTVSIGIAAYPLDGFNVGLLLQSGHLAMQKAKQSGKNTFRTYEPEMNTSMNKKLQLLNQLHRALEMDEFQLHYQPQINSLTGELIGMEALIRWNNSSLGSISPAEFIPLAEETGLIIPIGDWVLRSACEQNKKWQDMGYSPVPVSVNISAIQFAEPLFVEKVENIIRETGIDSKWLHIEITESVAIKDSNLTMKVLEKLKKIGIKIALDDFGTGFSSLGYLKKFKINVLKIDSSFVQDIGEDFTITKTIIVLGKSLNMDVIAEGVETKEQLDYLNEAGCNKIQGFFFSKPLPPHEFEKHLKVA